MAQIVHLKLVRDSASSHLRAMVSSVAPQQRRRIMSMMGQEFKRITLANFGGAGPHRASGWPPLSPGYAKAVGRQDATLFLSAAERVKVGKRAGEPHLKQKIMTPSVTTTQVTVVADVPYAAAHQLGKSGMPARPYFPVKRGGRITQFARDRIMTVIKQGLRAAGLRP